MVYIDSQLGLITRTTSRRDYALSSAASKDRDTPTYSSLWRRIFVNVLLDTLYGHFVSKKHELQLL